MNFNAINVTMFGVGVILLYSAIKGKSPKEVVQDAFKQSAHASKSATGSSKAPHSKTTNGPGSTASHSRSDFTEPFPTPSVYPSN